MSQDRIAGAAHKAKGAVKEAAGKVTGNTRMQAEGVAEKVTGNAQNKLGKAKDTVANALKR